MNLVKDVTFAKVAAAIVGVAMVSGLTLAFAAQRAHAITTAELVELLIQLDIIPANKAADARAAVSSMGSSTGGTTTTTTGGSCTFTFTRDLKVGSTGADVQNLQKLLNMSADTQVSAAGAGAPGMETMYFGPATKAAVSKFQNKYAADILAPLGLTAGTGNFGVSTRAKANAVCAAGPATPGVPGVPSLPGVPGTGTSTGSTDNGSLSGGEATLEKFDRLNDPSSETVQENDEDIKVAGFKFDVKDADVALNRVDVRFEATAGNSGYSKKPWNYFDSVALYSGDKKLAEVDANSSSDWDDLTGDAYGVRFTNLSQKISEGDTANLYVAVTVKGGLDSEDENTTWNVWIPQDGIRARDGSGIDQYIGDADLRTNAADVRTFTTESAGQGEELKVALASSNPKASTIKVDKDNTTKDQTVLVFTLEAKDHDIEITKLPIQFVFTGGETFNSVISDVKLDVDGDTFGDYDLANGASSTASTTFDIDSGDLVIKKGDKATVKVIVNLLATKDGANYDSGDTVTASLDSTLVDQIEAEGADTLNASGLTGSAVGEIQTLVTSGIFGEVVSIDETKTAGDNATSDVGDFKFKIDVQAFDTTAYISATTSAVFAYHLEDGAGTTVSTSSVAALTSTATKEGNSYRIDDGDTETFTYTVTLNPDISNYYRAELDSITFGTTSANPYGGTHVLAPDQDFESDNLYLNK